MDAPAPPTTVTLPARAWALLAGLVVVLLVVFGAMLALLEAQRRHVASQDEKITRLSRAVMPALDAAGPLVGEARALVGPARRTGARLGGLAADAQGLIGDLRAGDLPGTLTVAASAARAAVPVLSTLARFDLPAALAALQHDVHLIRRLVLMQRQTLAVQRQSLATQKRSRAAQVATLEIARQTLRHVSNLDRRTGGQVPVPPQP